MKNMEFLFCLIACVCAIDMLVSKDMVHQDLQGVQMCTLEEECKRAARIALDSYNQDLVQ